MRRFALFALVLSLSALGHLAVGNEAAPVDGAEEEAGPPRASEVQVCVVCAHHWHPGPLAQVLADAEHHDSADHPIGLSNRPPAPLALGRVQLASPTPSLLRPLLRAARCV
jgi:hypothetical protein